MGLTTRCHSCAHTPGPRLIRRDSDPGCLCDCHVARSTHPRYRASGQPQPRPKWPKVTRTKVPEGAPAFVREQAARLDAAALARQVTCPLVVRRSYGRSTVVVSTGRQR